MTSIQPAASPAYQHRAGAPAPRRVAQIRTFHPRRGRLSGRHHDALERLWPRWGLLVPGPAPHVLVPGPAPRQPAATATDPDPAAPETTATDPDPAAPDAARVDLPGLFGRRAPVVLEIGSGMGEATAAMAAADSGRDYLAVEVHTPGIANLLALAERRGLTNVRVAQGDAIDLVRLLPAESLDAVHVFFPDPWPKARHHKRRLIQPAHVALLRSRLVAGGTLHCATDWAEYAGVMAETLAADPELVNAFDGYAPRPAHRPVTKFERRGLASGHQIFDLIFRRSAPPADRG